MSYIPNRKRYAAPDLQGSVKFHTIGDVSIWMTGTNRIYVVLPDGDVLFPKLQAGDVSFADNGVYQASPELKSWLFGVLRKQREIRSDWPTLEEDNTAFTYSDEW